VLESKEKRVLQGMTDRLIESGRSNRMEINVEKTKVMRMSRKPSPLAITTDQKPMENAEYFNYLGSIITSDERCTRESKSRIAMAKAAFNKNKNISTNKLDLNLRKTLMKCYVWSTALYDAEA
jgi:hypothetical protein